MKNVCGSTDTESGEPCGRVAGWGTDSEMGECRDHATEYTVPDKLTPDARERLVGAAARGVTHQHAAMATGITRQTLHNWLSEGLQHVEDDLDTELADLYLTYQRARGQGAVAVLDECSPEFVAERSFGYTKTERRELDLSPTDAENDTVAELEALFSE